MVAGGTKRAQYQAAIEELQAIGIEVSSWKGGKWLRVERLSGRWMSNDVTIRFVLAHRLSGAWEAPLDDIHIEVLASSDSSISAPRRILEDLERVFRIAGRKLPEEILLWHRSTQRFRPFNWQ